ncbi:MAG: amine oxidase [Candidatus Pelagibacter sp.]|nr:amine oxidase [Candidatus Pelagibacter sp.]OUV88080.1 MAG: amine oxidase [Pelagibacteraceae bacterium TMED136]|tara:strand:+ start:2223 stop:3437 length:1215 start_codon:yes stop_codon:yes gene_type:complete
MKKLIIIGSGISGLASSYYLRKKFKIKIFEQNDYLGGHTHTHCLINEKIYYDSGFIVFNDRNYPNFIKLINAIRTEYQKSNMSFSVTNKEINYEWAGKNLKTIFAIKNLFTKRYWKILKDIVKFSKLCDKDTAHLDYSLKNFLKKNNFSKEFINLYLLPMCSSIWSSDLEDIKNYNTSFIINFFKNHGLNNIITKRPTWFTIKNGSKSYIQNIIKIVKPEIYLNEKVVEIDQKNKFIKTINKKKYKYDHLIFANHTNQVKKILKKPEKKQLKLLNAVKYQKNNVVIHTDQNLMPKNIKNWSSWNYLYNNKKLVLTYWMNLLQNLSCKKNIFVTLNFNKVDKKSIIKKVTYEHPLFTKPLSKINKISQDAQGINNIWFTGAWLGYGFHEDGVKSALKVRKLINAK